MAERVLISQQTGMIESYLSALEEVQPKFQKLVDSILKTEVTPKVRELHTLIVMIRQNNMSEDKCVKSVEKYIKEKLIENIETPKIGGVKISREKLLDMIDIPNCRTITKELLDILYSAGLPSGFDLNYYVLNEGFVSIKETAESDITELYSIYVSDESQIKMYNIVKAIADNLNLLERKIGKNLFNDRVGVSSDLRFLKLNNGLWEVDPQFIISG